MTPAAIKGEPLAILNAILPEKSKAKAKAIVSTHRGNYETIPRTDLLAEIGKRVSNTKNYADGVQEGRQEDFRGTEIRRVREASRSRASSRFAPISNACCRSRRASLTSRSRRKQAGPKGGWRGLRPPVA